MSLCHATKEAILLKQLVYEITDEMQEPITIYEDNQAAIAIAKNPVFYSKTKHIDVSYHFTREAVQNKQITELL